MFANGSGDRDSIIIPKTLKMVLGASLLNTQQYKVRIKGKVEAIDVEAIEKGAFWSPSTKGRQLYFIYITSCSTEVVIY